MTARVLVDLGSLAEAEALLRWVDRCIEHTGGHPERLHPLYTVDGFELGPEAVIDTLPGYAGSRPVRVGNAANGQLQLDVFGPVADLIAAVADARGWVRDEERRVLDAMVQACERRWHEPDHGLWEARLPPRHHVYSKVMCWLAVDRALHVARRHDGVDRPDWSELRDRIGANVLEHGWHDRVGAYTVAYGVEDMDASSLWIGLSGLLADDDPRFLATVLKVESELRSGPVVYRYRWDDGLPGVEGGFHVCTSWLIEAYLRTGRRSDAEELFRQMLDTAGPTGLLPEQYDPLAERGLGNHPQAYSHLGLIRCAMLLDQAEVKA
jgi:GH15 family glucan-1,4-alpha-glucosidase